MSNKDDRPRHLLNELDKVDHCMSLIDVFNTPSVNIHVFLVHRDLVNLRGFRVDGLGRPDISIKQLVTV